MKRIFNNNIINNNISIINKDKLFYELGKTKVYFALNILELLETLRTKILNSYIINIQKTYRMYIIYKEYNKSKKSSTKIQTRIRIYLAIKQLIVLKFIYKTRHNASKLIQNYHRMKVHRKPFLAVS